MTGDKREGKAGEVGKCRRNGLSLGVEGMSDAEPRKLIFSIPGVWIDRFVGFRRPVLSGPLRGENGVERAWLLSIPEEVAGRVGILLMVRERFFTLRELDASGRAASGALDAAVGPCLPSSCAGPDSVEGFIMTLKGDRGRVELGDSGDELGDGSVMDGESKVELVVVGDESVDSEEIEAALLCWKIPGRLYCVVLDSVFVEFLGSCEL
jgi:hypothetical protein